MSSSTLELLSQPGIIIAVVGASDNPDKFGHAIYRDLKRKGYRVYPVNPNRETVDGDRAYRNLQALPKIPDIANLAVPPEASLTVAKECLQLGILNLWLQAGSESPEVLGFLEENGLNYMAGACIMVKTRRAK
ncbi:MAG: CoA-binding protein [Proteobacteria bacterium]|nr:CoA-binding protein [Pseudomonadota bacterium]